MTKTITLHIDLDPDVAETDPLVYASDISDMTGVERVRWDSDESLASLAKAVKEADDAAHGDSNDEEIAALQAALDEALQIIGYQRPPEED